MGEWQMEVANTTQTRAVERLQHGTYPEMVTT